MSDIVVFETTMGEFSLELYKLHAPKTCHNFVELAKMGYYDGTIFHRVIADFVSPWPPVFRPVLRRSPL